MSPACHRPTLDEVNVREKMSWAFVVAKFSSVARSSPALRGVETGDDCAAILVAFPLFL